MAVTFGSLGSAPDPTPETVGDYRVDLDAGLTYRNVDGRSWKSQGTAADDLLAALLAEPTTEAHLARGVVVIGMADTSPPVGTPAGTVVFQRTT